MLLNIAAALTDEEERVILNYALSKKVSFLRALEMVSGEVQEKERLRLKMETENIALCRSILPSYIEREVPNELRDTCFVFAKDSQPSSARKIASRGQGNFIKQKDDIGGGKICEFVFEKLSLDSDFLVSTPNTEVQDKFNKSWTPDLSEKHQGKFHFHVKSTPIETVKELWNLGGARGSISSMCSWSADGKDTDKELFRDDHTIDGHQIISGIRTETKVFFFGMYPVLFIHQNQMFEKPIIAGLEPSKRCVYHNTMREKLGEDQWHFARRYPKLFARIVGLK